MSHQESLQGNINFTHDFKNYSYEDYEYLESLIELEEHGNFLFAVVNAVCYSIIICISVPGNGFLLWVLLKQEGLKSSADLLLLFLTASDLIFTFTLLPWTVYHIRGWIFGEVACRLFNGGIFLGLYSYMMFLTVMTVHRYVAVVHPVFASSVGNRGRLYTLVSSAGVWLISVCFSLPEVFFSETKHGPDGLLCVASVNDVNMEMFFYFSQIILFFLMPFLIIAFCYARMGCTIHQSRIRSRNKHHALCLILSIAVGFFICWAPYNIFLFLYSLMTLGIPIMNQADSYEALEYTYCISHILAYSHCCLNPLVHIFGGGKFRRFLPRTRGFTRVSWRHSSHTFSNQNSFSGHTYL